MLEAEISRLSGLILVEAVEIATIVLVIVAGLTLGITTWHIRKQSKVSSADLILELLKPWRKTDFQELLNEIVDPNITQYDEDKLEKFLNQLEDIATFWKDGTLSENHVKEFFGSNLKTVRDDKFIQSYIKKWTDKNSEYYFVNLRELINKVDDWKI